MLVKFELKIPNRVGKNVRKFQGGGGFFYSYCTSRRKMHNNTVMMKHFVLPLNTL